MTSSAPADGAVRPVPRPASVGRAALLFAVYVLVQLVVVIVLEGAENTGLQTPPLAGLLISQIVAWPIVLYLAVRGSGATWRENFPLRRFSPRLIVPVIVLCLGLSVLLGQVASLIPQPEILDRLVERLASSPWYVIVASGLILAPIFEEAFHRGWLLTGLRARYSTRKAMVMSSVVFALCHLNPWQAVIAFPIGILFAWLVVRTGSLWPGIIGHAALNVTGDLVTKIMRAMGYGETRIEEMTFLPPTVLIAGGVFALVGWGWLARALRREPAAPPAR